MKDFLRRLDAELIRAGVWGRDARRLKEELRDHYLTGKAMLMAQGDSEPAAAERALEQLGDPVQLAQKTKAELDRHGGNWKSQVFIRLMPLAAGLGAFFAAVASIWVLAVWIRLFHWKFHAPEAFPAFAAALVLWHLIPWLAIYLWLLRASYSPAYGWDGLLVVSGYATLSCYVFTTWPLFTGDGVNFYIHPAVANVVHLVLVLVLLITPWRVRARKLAEAKRG